MARGDKGVWLRIVCLTSGVQHEDARIPTSYGAMQQVFGLR